MQYEWIEWSLVELRMMQLDASEGWKDHWNAHCQGIFHLWKFLHISWCCTFNRNLMESKCFSESQWLWNQIIDNGKDRQQLGTRKRWRSFFLVCFQSNSIQSNWILAGWLVFGFLRAKQTNLAACYWEENRVCGQPIVSMV